MVLKMKLSNGDVKYTEVTHVSIKDNILSVIDTKDRFKTINLLSKDKEYIVWVEEIVVNGEVIFPVKKLVK